MIVSHRHRFIFLKTSKTAGTSVEIALSAHCGPEDVITPVHVDDEAVRRSLGYRGPQHSHLKLSEFGLRDWQAVVSGSGGLRRLGRALRGKHQRLRFYNHIPASDVRRLVGGRVWDSYYKFCFERNPWDRVISLYYWWHPTPPRPSLDEFVASPAIERLKVTGRDVYIIEGRVAVDRVFRYETLPEDLEELGRQLGLPGLASPPRTKAKTRPKDSDRSLLSDASRRRIAELFRPEIEMFGYEF